jgi:N utilization substance protein B
MHKNKSLSRELSLISLGLIKDNGDLKLNKFQIEEIFESALDSLINHCREELDNCESDLENASQKILDSELQEGADSSFSNVRNELKNSLKKIETVMNTLSVTLDFPKLIVSSGQIDIRDDVNNRISKIINNLKTIDSNIDQVMDDWRLKRLPRIDRDILRLAYVDINFFETPVAVACDEAVNLANKYSDMQGRKFINGVLRRLQTVNIQ